MVKYVNNNRLYGVDYNWRKLLQKTCTIINEVCKENGIDKKSVYQSNAPLDSIMWNVELSERKVGKTTFYLLLGLVAKEEYPQFKIEYIRNTKDEVAPSNAQELFTTIIDYGYISKIFPEYNSIQYSAKGWYLCHSDGDKIDKMDVYEACHMHNLQSGVDATKSGYNSPYGDLILWDEAIPVDGITTENRWISFCQLLDTITRQRISCRVIILANTINAYTHLFHELEIVNKVSSLKMGDEVICESSMGVKVWVHKIKFNDSEISKKRLDINLFKYGFKNPRLGAIIGNREWESRNYQHLSHKEEGERINEINSYLYIKYYNHLLRIRLFVSNIRGMYALIHESLEEPKDDAIIYTCGDISKFNERFCMGNGDRIDGLIWGYLYKNNRFYYSYNDIGTVVDSYIKECKASKKAGL